MRGLCYWFAAVAVLFTCLPSGILPVGGELTCFSADDCHGEVVPLPTMSTPGDCCSEKGLSYEELVGGERECISCFREEAFMSPGNDFYFAFVDNFRISRLFTRPILRLSIGPMKNETVQVEVEESGRTQTYTTSLDNPIEVGFGGDIRLSTVSERDKGIHVASVNREDISVVAVGADYQSADTFKVLPYVYLPNDGYEYYAVSVPASAVDEDFAPLENSFIAIVAVEDGTMFTIELTQDVAVPSSVAAQLGLDTTMITAGEVEVILLQQRQSLYLSTVEDLTGSRVVSNKPISFTSGHECAAVPNNRRYCDQLVEQIPPTSTWGTEFYTIPVVNRSAYDIFKVISSRDDTFFTGSCVKQSDSGQQPTTVNLELSAGEVKDFLIQSDEYCLFTSDGPTILFQFSVGSLVDNNRMADPFMVMIPPKQQYQDSYFVSTFDLNPEFVSSISVVVPMAYDRNGVLLNGEMLIPDSGWVEIPCLGETEDICAYSSQTMVDNGNHRVSHLDPEARFSVIVHWLALRTGHGYMGGMTQKPIALPQVTLSTDYLEVYENVSVINFAVDRSGDTSIPAVVHFKTINVAVDDETERPARAGVDYRFVDRTVEFAAGETRQEVPVRIFDDIFPEENRTFEVILSCSPGVYISPHSYTTVKILNDDPDLPVMNVSFSKTTLSVVEGVGLVELVLVKTPGGVGPVSVKLTTQDGTATALDDYSPVTEIITFDANTTLGIDELEARVTVLITDNVALEGREFFTVNITAIPGIFPLTVMDSVATVEIDDNDIFVVGFSPASYFIDEDNRFLTLFVVRQYGTLAETVTVLVTTVDGTAEANVDYRPVIQTLHFDPGVTRRRQVSIEIFNDDSPEPMETFTVRLQLQTNTSNVLLIPAEARVSIEDDDTTRIGLFLLGSNVTDEDKGSVGVVVRVAGTGISGTATVGLTTVSGTATAGRDFQAIINREITLSSEITDQVVSIPLVEDNVLEALEESFTVLLSLLRSDERVMISPSSVQITIRDVDEPKPVSCYVETGTCSDVRKPFVTRSIEECCADINIRGRSFTSEAAPRLCQPCIVIGFEEEEITLIEGRNHEITVRPVIGFLPQALSLRVTAFPGTALSSDFVLMTEEIILTTTDDEAKVMVNIPRERGGHQDLPFETFSLQLTDTVGLSTQNMFFRDILLTIQDSVLQIGFSSAQYTAQESSGAVTLLIISNGVNEEPVQIQLSPIGGTASGSDFVFPLRSITLAAGATQQRLVVQLTNDVIVEDTETFSVRISVLDEDTRVQPDTTTVFIEDDDSVAVGFTSMEYTVSEMDGQAVLQLTKEGEAEIPVQVTFQTQDGSAIAGLDYVAETGVTVEFLPAESEQTVEVTILDDGFVEQMTEEFFGIISPGQGVSISRGSTAIRILEDDSLVTIGFTKTEYAATESTGTAIVVLEVERGEGTTATPLSVTLSLVSGTATADLDYDASSDGRVLQFGTDGTEIQRVQINLLDDILYEGPETFTAVLTANNPEISQTPSPVNTAVVTISDDESVTLGFLVPVTTQAEGSHNVSISVVVKNAGDVTIDEPIPLSVRTRDGTATGTLDYQPQTLDIVFPPRALFINIMVPFLDDTIVEATENFSISLSTSAPRVSLDIPEITVNIEDRNDRVSIGLVATDLSVVEGNSLEVCVILLSGTLDREIVGRLQTVAGTATESTDYQPVDMELRFDGVTTCQRITSIEDTILEGSEFFNIILSTADPDVSVLDDSALITILDDDVVTIGFENTAYTTDEGETLVICVIVLGPLEREAIIRVTSKEGSAEAEADYTPVDTQLVFRISGSVLCIRVSIEEDELEEEEEQFSLVLTTNDPGLMLSPAEASVTIIGTQPMCTDLPNPTNGVVEYDPAGPHFLGTVATYSCNVGYILGTPSNVICEEGAEGPEWSDTTTPTCTPVGLACYSSPSCDGAFTAEDSPRDCCLGDGVAFTMLGEEGCFICRVFGWLIEGQSLDGNLTLSIPEQDEDITVPVGYIKATELGVIPDLPPQALDQTLTVMAVPITADGAAPGRGTIVDDDDGLDFTLLTSSVVARVLEPESVFVRIPVDDLALEPNETFLLTLLPTNELQINEFLVGSLIVSIQDSDNVTVDFLPSDDVLEREGILFVTLMQSTYVAQPYTVQVVGGTLFQDFVVTSGPAEVDEIVEFGPGHLTAIFILNVTDDLIALESNESVILFMSEPSNPRVKLGIAESVVNIIDDDTVAVGFFPSNYTFSESDGSVVVSVTSTAVVIRPFSVLISGGPLPQQFVEISGPQVEERIQFGAGFGNPFIDVLLNITDDDVALEVDEVFTLTVSSPSDPRVELGANVPGVGLIPAEAVITIVDDDMVTIGFDPVTVSVVETMLVLEFNVSIIDGFLDRSVEVTFFTINGTALAGLDFRDPGEIPLQFDSTATSRTVRITIFDDAILEANENFFGLLVTTDAAVIFDPSLAEATIIEDNDEVTIGFRPTDYSTLESQGTVDLTIEVISGMLGRNVEINFSTQDGTATGGVDFTMTPPGGVVIQFSPSQLSVDVPVTILDDSIVEANENFFGLLTNPVGDPVILNPDRATVIITDTDDSVTIGAENTTIEVDEDAGSLEICLRIFDGELDRPVTVTGFTREGTATDPEDYIGGSVDLVFSTDQTRGCGIVDIVYSPEIEEDETFTAISSTTDVAVLLDPVLITITIRDIPPTDVILCYTASSCDGSGVAVNSPIDCCRNSRTSSYRSGQECSSCALRSDMGEFYLSFIFYQQFLSELSGSVVLFATGEPNAVDVLYSDRRRNRTVTVEGGARLQVEFADGIVVSPSDRDKGFRISIPEDERVSVYGSSIEEFGASAFHALPCTQLPVREYEFYAVSAPPATVNFTAFGELPLSGNSVFLVVACEDDTTVTFTPTQVVADPDSPSSPEILPFESKDVTLNAMQTLYVASSEDLSGSRVVANKPISFFSGHESAHIPPNATNPDHLVEQFPPSGVWGYFFLTAPFPLRQAMNIFKVVASENFTQVPIECTNANGTSMFVETLLMDAGQVSEFITPPDVYCVVAASSPILLVHLTPGNSFTEEAGGAMMVTVPPINHYTNNITFPVITPSNEFFPYNAVVNVFVTPEFYDPELITVDGAPIDSWVVINCFEAGGPMVDICGYTAVVFIHGLRDSVHTIRHGDSEGKLMAIVYASTGFTGLLSYGFVGGVELAAPDVPELSFSAEMYTVLEGDTLLIPIQRLRAASPFDYGLLFDDTSLSTATDLKDYTIEDSSRFAVFTASHNTYKVQLTTYADDLQEDAETIEFIVLVGPETLIRTTVVILDAPAPSNEGSEFFIGFMVNSHMTQQQDSQNIVRMITDDPNGVEVNVTHVAGKHTFFLLRDVPASAFLSPTVSEVTGPTDRQKGVEAAITSLPGAPFAVYGISRKFGSVEGYLALPCINTANMYEYFVISPPSIGTNGSSAFLVVPCQDQTSVMIREHKQSDRPTGLTLNKGETYYYVSSTDLTRFHITTDKPISLFSGHECGVAGDDSIDCNHLVEQLPPVSAWGNFFLTAPIAVTAKLRLPSIIKLITIARDTSVNVTCTDGGRLFTNAIVSDSLNFTVSASDFCSIESSSPILVVQLPIPSQSGFDDVFMTLVPAVSQYRNDLTVVPLAENDAEDWVNLFVPANYFNVEAIFFGSVTTSLSSWVAISCSNGGVCGYALHMSLRITSTVVRHTNPDAVMGAIVYGHSIGQRLGRTSYGYPAGLSLVPADVGPITIGLEQSLIVVNEDADLLEICARVFSGPSLNQEITLTWFLSNGTAVEREDYEEYIPPVEFVFESFVERYCWFISIIDGPEDVEQNETFTVSISVVSDDDDIVLSPETTTVVIVDVTEEDDPDIQCADGTSVDPSLACDGICDCEISCEDDDRERCIPCRDDFFTCDTGSPACIPLNWTCDGVPNDCPDNSDESNCDFNDPRVQFSPPEYNAEISAFADFGSTVFTIQVSINNTYFDNPQSVVLSFVTAVDETPPPFTLPNRLQSETIAFGSVNPIPATELPVIVITRNVLYDSEQLPPDNLPIVYTFLVVAQVHSRPGSGLDDPVVSSAMALVNIVDPTPL